MPFWESEARFPRLSRFQESPWPRPHLEILANLRPIANGLGGDPRNTRDRVRIDGGGRSRA